MTIELKTDPENPHHYILSVGIHSMISNKAGKMYLKHGPIYFNNEDVDKVRDALMLASDKLFKTTKSEALEIVDKNSLCNSINSMMIAASVNQCSLHHFSSEYEISDESLEMIVDSANNSTYLKSLLMKALI